MDDNIGRVRETDADAPDLFDIVIVGAGSAGCVLANRLSEDPAVRVCLIEAGPRDRNPLIHVPLGFLALYQHRRLNWRFWSSPQDGASGRSIYIPRGRTLGGSSAINGMVYMRGHAGDYDDWAAGGARGWAYRDVLPYFTRSENNERWRHSPYHGTGGLLNVTDPDAVNPLVETFFAAAAARRIPHCPDFNIPCPDGYGLRQLNQRNGRRESAATAFLAPVLGRRNLTVLTDGQVRRILLEDRRAVGVELSVAGGAVRRIGARREVVLAAGSIGSPAILMHSGIGDGGMLAAAGVPLVHALPGVGRNYQDHVCAEVRFSSPVAASYGVSWRSLPRVAGGLAQYALFRRGFLTSTLIYGSAFLRSDPALDRPDIQLVFLPARRPARGMIAFGHGYGVIPIVLRPKSRGSITLASPDPLAPPRIDPRFLSAEDDLERLLKAVRIGRDLLYAPAFDRYRGEELAPGPAVQEPDALRRFIRDTLGTAQHPVGTCAMGSGPDTVVDPQLRVHGIAGLRVADASVMPTLIGGNTNAPVTMIAEKAADLIRGRSLPPADLPADIPAPVAAGPY